MSEQDKHPRQSENGLQQLFENSEAFADNAVKLSSALQKVALAYAKHSDENKLKSTIDDAGLVTSISKSISSIGEYWLADSNRLLEAQQTLYGQYAELFYNTAKRLSGEAAAPVIEPAKNDRRFKGAQWSENVFFDTLKQFYLISSGWTKDMLAKSELQNEHEKEKAIFFINQILDALSPTNFFASNPEVLARFMSTNGGSLVQGLELLAEDIEAGRGHLKLRQTGGHDFQVGKDMAATPGKVVAENDLCQIIQYQPTTEKVLKRPLLIVPPWINKFYILDLNEKKSFIRWALSEGHSVFVISWVNPDENHAKKDFSHYMREGIFLALDTIAMATGEKEVNAIGYCVGGTLLTIALAYMAQKKDRRIATATFFAAQSDFTHAGDLLNFIDEDMLEIVASKMQDKGYLQGADMADAFNMLRANDLIWPYIINNYLKGQEPDAFDLLFWNSDSTRIPAANHLFYLRNCYLENNLSQNKMEIDGVKLDMKKITVPVYNLAAKEDHIAPAKSVFHGAKLFGGPMRYVLAGSGHIAGVINPPEAQKYQYWTGRKPSGNFENWMEKAKEHPGSWWPDWQSWILSQDKTLTDARKVGGNKLSPIEDAPGRYVLVKS